MSRARITRAMALALVIATSALSVTTTGTASAQELPFPIPGFELPSTGSSGTGSSDTGSSGTGSSDSGSSGPDTTAPNGGLQLLSPNRGESVLGIPIETLSDNPQGAIVVNGVAMPATTDRQNLLIAVLDAKTGGLLQSGTQPNDVNGLNSFTGIVDNFKNKNDTIVVVSGFNGVRNAGREPALGRLVRALGGTPMSTNDLGRMEFGAPFSMIGKTAAVEGVAYTRVAVEPGDRAGGDITGLLRWNSIAGGWYDFTPPAPVEYSSNKSSGSTVTVAIGDRTYPTTAPGSDGFRIQAFDSQTLEPAYSANVVTGNPVGDQELSADLDAVSKEVDNAGRPYLVFVQSFGKPVPSARWQQGADAILRMGGSRLAFLNLNGTSDYTLLGSADPSASPLEVGTLLGKPGPSVGLLTRSHDFSYRPMASGALGDVDLLQSKIMYQAPYQGGSTSAPTFPAIDRAAEQYIGWRAGVRGCTTADSAACDVRFQYRNDFLGSWDPINTALTQVTYPSAGPERTFTEDQFNTALTQLRQEIRGFIEVRNYYVGLQQALSIGGTDPMLNIKKIGDDAVNTVAPPPGPNVVADGLKSVSTVMNYVTFAIPELKAVWGQISTIWGLVAPFTGPSGNSALANKIRVRADQLSSQLSESLRAATYGFTSVGLVMVSDYGKLTAAKAEIDAGRWALPPNPADVISPLSDGLKTTFLKTLVPIAFPWLMRGTGPPSGPSDASGLTCAIYEDLIDEYEQRSPWRGLPQIAQMRSVWNFDGSGQPIVWNMFFTRENPDTSGLSSDSSHISADLAGTMFGTARGQLGINLYDFMSPRYFGTTVHQVDHTARKCNLG
ncbi:hypothetical protein [Rhodococcoides yunnanense]|uniref:hypothetical protein n=1 Tax=Rhodococcoides yunnanense TaxID=278209 RepID=UPI001114D14D|nr:hypothetical protein [Rhodococcus yunnanensis]